MPLYGTGQAVGGSFETTDDVSGLLGEIRFGNTGFFRYGKAGAALAKGDVCTFSNDGKYTASKTATPAAIPFGICIPQSDMTSGSYGWFFIGGGTFQANVAAGVIVGSVLTTTGTAGQLGAGGTKIGAVNTGATAGAAAVVNCYAPTFLACTPYT